jgi:NTP pyrophosphatase (non-canonical NTP hydrolase)
VAGCGTRKPITVVRSAMDNFEREWKKKQVAVHQSAVDHGFWDEDRRNILEKIALIHSELSEFVECYRSEDRTKQDEHCPGYYNVSIELADVVIRTMDLAERLNMDLGGAIEAKSRYNLSRPHMHGKRM